MLLTSEQAGLRLDVWLAEALSITRSAAVRLIEDGGVRVDGAPAPKKLKLCGGAPGLTYAVFAAVSSNGGRVC